MTDWGIAVKEFPEGEYLDIGFRMQFFCKKCKCILSPNKLVRGCRKCQEKEDLELI